MRYSNLFGKTQKEVNDDIKVKSHKLLIKAGYISESTSGRYYMLPLGIRVQNKIIEIIRKHMDNFGGNELSTPVMHPLDLWKETNRTASAGFELLTVKDRHGAEFALGGTAEEMMVDLIRRYNISYKELPILIYQFSTKFRDELRARGGLLRVREFIMKDGYSFHTNAAEFEEYYKWVSEVYFDIFSELGLEVSRVESDNGYIGGEYCHEYILDSEIGESTYLVDDSGYSAHEEVAVFNKSLKEEKQDLKDLELVEVDRENSMQSAMEVHGIPLERHIKHVVYANDDDKLVIAVIRGDLDVNELKLKHVIKTHELKPVSEQRIKDELKTVPGYISLVNIEFPSDVIIVGDDSILDISNGISGGNKHGHDYTNINYSRDYSVFNIADIAQARAGHLSSNGQELIQKVGIEVGNIFQLGTHYTDLMKGSEYTDQKGARKPYYMGCYGIGIGRTMAAIAEKYSTDDNLNWPTNIAPFQLSLILLNTDDTDTVALAEKYYELLVSAGVEVLYDDRSTVSAGQKFNDSELIGIPNSAVVSKRNGDSLEVKIDSESKLISIDELIEYIKLSPNETKK